MQRPRPGAVLSRVQTLLGWALALVLIAFHAVLLWQRLVDATLLEPVPALRWLATLALSAVLWRWNRNGVSLLRGRAALVFWLLVLLLHASFWGPLSEATDSCEGWSGQELLLALPAITIALGVVFPEVQRLLARALAGTESSDLPWIAFTHNSQSFALRAGCLPILSCRPPPIS